MQQIQLYIEGERVDMFDFESVTITTLLKTLKILVKYLLSFLKRSLYLQVKLIIRYLNIITIVIFKMDLMQE